MGCGIRSVFAKGRWVSMRSQNDRKCRCCNMILRIIDRVIQSYPMGHFGNLTLLGNFGWCSLPTKSSETWLVGCDATGFHMLRKHTYMIYYNHRCIILWLRYIEMLGKHATRNETSDTHRKLIQDRVDVQAIGVTFQGYQAHWFFKHCSRVFFVTFPSIPKASRETPI